MTRSETVWIIDDDKSIRWVLERALAQANIATQSFVDADDALNALDEDLPEAIISDIRMPGTDGLKMLGIIHKKYPALPIIIITAHSDLDSAVASYQGGAFEYLPKPFDVDEAVALVKRALAQSREKANTNVPIPERKSVSADIIGNAPAMQEVFRAIGRLSHSNVTVLINGESGTGKELVARALHKHSPRAAKSFVALNMAAIPRDLIESELFGHEKGAFTGATEKRTGRFEQANGGTLFLDEIGDMPLEAQTRLLRVLSDNEFYRVGGTAPIKADVRIIAATHQNLENLVREGRFREDLFHRINVIRIHLPRLAARREDIAQLAGFFLKTAAREMNVEAKILRPETANFLAGLDWPGNVRQLENTCRWLTVMASGREILLDDLPPELHGTGSGGSAGHGTAGSDWETLLRIWVDQELARGSRAILDTALPVFERLMIEAALAHTAGRRRDASLLLGWGRNTLTRKIKELDLEDRLRRANLDAGDED